MLTSLWNDLEGVKSRETDDFGNSIFSVDFPLDTPLDPPPTFTEKENFKLERAVDFPEFLIDFRRFEDLAAKHGLKFVEKCRFQHVIAEEKTKGINNISKFLQF